MSSAPVQAKHKTWIPEDDLRPVWKIDVSPDCWLAWRTKKEGCRYLQVKYGKGTRVKYRIRKVQTSGFGPGRFRTIQYWGPHVREISQRMAEERKDLRAKYPGVIFYGCEKDVDPRYRRGGTGKPILTPDLKDYGFPTKPDGSVDVSEYWRDKSCPSLGGERFDAALLYVDVGEGWRGRPWRWVWCESHAITIGKALQRKAEEIKKGISSGEIIPSEELIPNECRENQRPDGAPWFTNRVVEYLKLADRFGKEDPADLLHSWQPRCYHLPEKRGMRSMSMRNGRLVWYDEDVQLLHTRFSKAPPRGRLHDETNLPAENRVDGRSDGLPLRVGIIERLARRKFNFNWLQRCPYNRERQGLDFVLLSPAGAMVFIGNRSRRSLLVNSSQPQKLQRFRNPKFRLTIAATMERLSG